MQRLSKLQYVSQYLRSIIFMIVMVVFAVLYSLLCIALYPLPLRYRHPIVIQWTAMMTWVCKIICKIDYHVEGLENIPRDRNGIILSKHQSAWETLYLPSRFHQVAIILKKELLSIPFFGWALAVTSPIGIDRNDKSSAMSQIISKGKEYLNAGRWVLVFPEGTRIESGKVGVYRLGGARLAVETGCPILPVAHNAGRFWPHNQFIKYPGTVRVVFGPLIETKGRTAEEVMAEAKDWIESTILKIDSAP